MAQQDNPHSRHNKPSQLAYHNYGEEDVRVHRIQIDQKIENTSLKPVTQAELESIADFMFALRLQEQENNGASFDVIRYTNDVRFDAGSEPDHTAHNVSRTPPPTPTSALASLALDDGNVTAPSESVSSERKLEKEEVNIHTFRITPQKPLSLHRLLAGSLGDEADDNDDELFKIY